MMDAESNNSKYPKRFLVVIIGVIGDILQGGLIFGWPSLSLMLKELGNYAEKCHQEEHSCKTREQEFSLDWNAGVFAVNFVPVLVGPALDHYGPRFVTVFASVINIGSLILLARSSSKFLNAFPLAMFGLGFGGIAFHLSQFNKSDAFPTLKGTVSSCFNAGFSISSTIMLVLYVIWRALGSTQFVFQMILYLYACIILAYIPLLIIYEPPEAVGVYLERKVLQQKMQAGPVDEAKQPLLSEPVQIAQSQALQSHPVMISSAPSSGYTPHQLFGTPPGRYSQGEHSILEQQYSLHTDSLQGEIFVEDPPSISPPRGSQAQGLATPNGAAPTHPDDSPILFKYKSPRWAWLRKQNFVTQMTSAEAIGMCFYYTISVVMLQFYIGTARLQLFEKGDVNHFYTNLTGPILAMGFVAVPFVGWLLDSVGYGTSFLVILVGGILESLLQAVPNLQVQILTLAVWSIDRFCLYAAYYSIVGSIFGFTNFGKIVGVKSFINGLVGFLQYPMLSLALGPLNGKFWIINIAQAVVLSLLIPFCIKMMIWARPDAQPPKSRTNRSQQVTEI